MTIENLEEYTHIKKEICQLECKIEQLRKIENSQVTDVVRGSSTSFPYIEHNIKISGMDNKHKLSVDRLSKLWFLQIEKANAKLMEMEVYISNLKSSEVKQIIRLKYIDGNSWNAVSIKMYGYPCSDRVRKRITRLFK